MTAYKETCRALAERRRMLRDAYHSRNGLSMTEEQRTAYRAMLDRAKAARQAGNAVRVRGSARP